MKCLLSVSLAMPCAVLSIIMLTLSLNIAPISADFLYVGCVEYSSTDANDVPTIMAPWVNESLATSGTSVVACSVQCKDVYQGYFGSFYSYNPFVHFCYCQSSPVTEGLTTTSEGNCNHRFEGGSVSHSDLQTKYLSAYQYEENHESYTTDSVSLPYHDKGCYRLMNQWQFSTETAFNPFNNADYEYGLSIEQCAAKCASVLDGIFGHINITNECYCQEYAIDLAAVIPVSIEHCDGYGQTSPAHPNQYDNYVRVYQAVVPPTTVIPTTAIPTTVIPTTAVRTTVIPTTVIPTTAVRTTAVPSTTAPHTTSAATTAKETSKPTTTKPTSKPTTSSPTTIKPTPKPTTLKPTTGKPTKPRPTVGVTCASGMKICHNVCYDPHTTRCCINGTTKPLKNTC